MSYRSLEVLLRVCENEFVLNGKWGLGECSVLVKILSINVNGRAMLVRYFARCGELMGLECMKFSAVRQFLQLFALNASCSKRNLDM